jgi:hypothetical protein
LNACDTATLYLSQFRTWTSLEPDGRFLRTCQNPGALDEDIIHAIMENIEALHL